MRRGSAAKGDVLDFILKVIGTLGGVTVVLGALIGGTYWLFQTFSERWLQAKFDARLADLSHTHNQELERLKFRINAQMDRTTKLHEREYQVLPEIWEALASAWGEVSAFTSPFQSVADVGRMSNEQMEEHLARSDLFESQKQAVRVSSDRTKTFQQENYWHRKVAVENHVRKFTRALRFNGVFVPKEIKTKLSQAADIIWAAVSEHTMNEEHEVRPRERTAQKRLSDEGKTLLDDIEKDIQERLWSIAGL